jgi:hypothetical protein
LISVKAKGKSMSFLSSIPFLSAGSGVLGFSVALLTTALMLALWLLALLILHPLHATIFVLAAVLEYALIYFFGFYLWLDLIAFFLFYIILFGTYNLLLRRFLPLPKSEVELLIKLSNLQQEGLLNDEEYKAAKKRLLKL